MTLRVKTANDKELSDFIQYLKHEYDQIHKQTCNKRRLAAEGKAGLDQGSMHDYVQAAEALLNSKRAQLQVVRAEAASRQQWNIQTKVSKDGAAIENYDVSQGAQFQDAAQSRQQGRDVAASSLWVQPRVWHGSASAGCTLHLHGISCRLRINRRHQQGGARYNRHCKRRSSKVREQCQAQLRTSSPAHGLCFVTHMDNTTPQPPLQTRQRSLLVITL